MLFVQFYAVRADCRQARGTDVVEKELFARTGEAFPKRRRATCEESRATALQRSLCDQYL
jgi:hypothetical protein